MCRRPNLRHEIFSPRSPRSQIPQPHLVHGHALSHAHALQLPPPADNIKPSPADCKIQILHVTWSTPPPQPSKTPPSGASRRVRVYVLYPPPARPQPERSRALLLRGARFEGGHTLCGFRGGVLCAALPPRHPACWPARRAPRPQGPSGAHGYLGGARLAAGAACLAVATPCLSSSLHSLQTITKLPHTPALTRAPIFKSIIHTPTRVKHLPRPPPPPTSSNLAAALPRPHRLPTSRRSTSRAARGVHRVLHPLRVVVARCSPRRYQPPSSPATRPPIAPLPRAFFGPPTSPPPHLFLALDPPRRHGHGHP